jgi:hypothetical protein
MINEKLKTIDKSHLDKNAIVRFLNTVLKTGIGMTKMDNSFKQE